GVQCSRQLARGTGLAPPSGGRPGSRDAPWHGAKRDERREPPGRPTVKRILVPLDGSRLSEAVLPLAEALAREYEADLLLIRALPTLNSVDAEVTARDEATAYLTRTVAALEGRGLRAEWKVWYDAPDRALADAAQLNGVELIAMTTHGRG